MNITSPNSDSVSLTCLTRKDFFERVFPDLKAIWKDKDFELYQFENPRSRNVIDNLDYLADCRVLDVGCNSGIYSLLLAANAAHVHGIDVNAKYLEAAEAAKQYFREHVYSVDNVSFERTTLSQLRARETNFDAILACNVLYHLTDEEIDVMRDLLKGCRRVLFQMRPRRQLAYERNKESFYYVSRNSVCGGMFTIGHAVEFLESEGFRNFQIKGEENYWLDEVFPVVMASRD
jgi:cyclopropane fatty-acyl-phospholipid synthase-like methyltransferase